jgi:non-canonical (house-cleaning) NTP pyrophosphatase
LSFCNTKNNNPNNISNDQQEVDFAVGLEGGLEKSIHPQTNQEQLYCMAWMAIVGTCSSKNARSTQHSENDNGDDGTSKDDTSNHTSSQTMYWSYAKTASFLLPPTITELVLHQNMELGHADDAVFDRTNSKHGSGTVGILTGGQIDRKAYYVHALKLCLIPWLNDGLYLR